MRNRNSRILIIESLILFMILVFVTVIIVEALVMSRSRSLQAEQLTEAVIIAGNTAEAASTADSMEKLSEALGKMYEITYEDIESPAESGFSEDVVSSDNAVSSANAASSGNRVLSCGVVKARGSLDADEGGNSHLYDIVVERTVESRSGGAFIKDTISIYEADADPGAVADADSGSGSVADADSGSGSAADAGTDADSGSGSGAAAGSVCVAGAAEPLYTLETAHFESGVTGYGS